VQPRRGIVPILFFPAVASLGAACTEAPRQVTAPVAAPSFAKDDGGPKRTYVYTNNDVFGMNTVSAFSVGEAGTLTPVPGSPFATGGQVKQASSPLSRRQWPRRGGGEASHSLRSATTGSTRLARRAGR
jgi:hypothetical protein